MAKKLVIVESPTKARTLKRFLGSDFVVEASGGHVRDLPKSKMGVDVDKNFEVEYTVTDGKSKTVSMLKKEAKAADEVFLATDPDREGEAIAWHIARLLANEKTEKLRNNTLSKLKRVSFHEITKSAIEAAMLEPTTLNQDLVDAQQARRVLDRLVGYKLSPVLWKKVRRGLSAGRVQSVAVKLIVEKEKEIDAFDKKEYWEVLVKLQATLRQAQGKLLRQAQGKLLRQAQGRLLRQTGSATLTTSQGEASHKTQDFWVELVEIDGKKVAVLGQGEKKDKDKAYLDHEKVVTPILNNLNKAAYIVAGVEKKEQRRNPYPPYTTSTLQQAAANVLGWTAKQTMAVAQQLYEQGLITYHRTDSFNIANEAVKAARAYIETAYGSSYLPEKPIVYATKSKNAQEAHEAIRPTSVVTSDQLPVTSDGLDERQKKLYRLIWQRFVACQMTAAVYDQTSVTVLATSHKPQATSYRLRANGKVMKFEGWRAVYNRKLETRNSKPETINSDVLLPDVTEGEALKFLDLTSEQKFTQPPARYNDASLIKELEKRGIGRPSTYAPTISTIIARGYVERVERRFSPSAVGDTVTTFLDKNFAEIMDYDFTAEMEEDLDRISRGEKEWKKVLKAFYSPFKKKVGEVEKNAQRAKVPVEKTDEKCPECKEGMLVIRSGRFGKFLSCERFPECKYTASFTKKLENFACPECGGDVVMKRTRKGRSFWGCSNYPKCEYASWKDPRVEQKKADTQ